MFRYFLSHLYRVVSCQYERLKINISISIPSTKLQIKIFSVVLGLYLLQIVSRFLLDYVYDPWSPWGECDVSCGNGTRVRQRKCHKQKKCTKEEAEQTEACAADPCLIDGGIILYTYCKRTSF